MITTGSILPSVPIMDVWQHSYKRTEPSGRRPAPGSLDGSERDGAPYLLGSAGQAAGSSIAFGPFRLYPRQRLLVEGDKPLRIGSRALDILILLLERPGELVSKQQLIAQVWPGIVVEEANLKVHIAALRRALRDGQMDGRYICTVSGRGYCFVAPVTLDGGTLPNATPEFRPGSPRARALPAAADDLIGMLAKQLSQQRFVTVVGAGDMVKGIFLAAALMTDYRHGIRIIDLATLADPLRLPSAVAAAIGIEAGSQDLLAGLTAFLEDKHMLLVIDNCRHLVGAIAGFASSILASTAGIRILAIGR